MKRTLVSLIALLGLILTPLMGAAAQPVVSDQVFTSALTGEDIDLGTSGEITFLPDDYELRENRTYSEEFVWFTAGGSNFQLAFVDGPTTADQYHEVTLENMNEFYDTFEVLDQQIREDGSWFIGDAVFNGNPLIVYYEFELDVFGDTDLLVMQFSGGETILDDLEFVQSEVTIGDFSLLDYTDSQTIADTLGMETGEDTGTTETTTRTTRTSRTAGTNDTGSEGNISETSSGGEDSTPEATEESTTGRTSRTTRGSDTSGEDSTPEATEESTTGRTSRTTRGSDTGAEDPTPEATEESTTGRSSVTDDAGDWESLGLISDTEWQSPTFDTTIAWDGDVWEFPRDYDEAIYINTEPEYDVITLQTTDGLGYVFVTIEDQGDNTPRTLASFFNSPEYVDGFANPATVLDSSSTATTASVVYETTNANDQSLIVVVDATFLDDGTIVYSQISAAPETIHEVYGQFADGVTGNGDPLEMTWTVEDIQEISGN